MHSPQASARRTYWEDWFARGEDPWSYDNPYETVKYRQTLQLLPPGRIGTALELGCAEGHSTAQLAGRVDRLIASDISPTALRRAAARCASLHNTDFRCIDFISDPLPEGLDLLVCSESLYYADREALPELAAKFAGALRPGGHLLMAHAMAIADRRDRTGFDWGAPFGVETIAAVFAAADGLALIKELRTALYRIQLFRRLGPGETGPAAPAIVEAEHGALPPSVARWVIWDGAATTRAEAEREEAREVPILMYHSIAADGPEALRPYRVTPAQFAEQLKYLRRHGYHSISLDEWAGCMAGRQPARGRPVIITFDDGYKDFVTTAAPLLEAADFRAVVFVVTDKTGGVADWDDHAGPPLPLMGWDDLRGLEARGFAIGSHTTAHRDLTRLSDGEIVRDGEAARNTLGRELGHPVDCIAFPWGLSDGRVRAALAQAGYRIGVSVETRRSALSDEPGCLPRIEIFGDDDLDSFARKLRLPTAPVPAAAEAPSAPALAAEDRSGPQTPELTPRYLRRLARRTSRLAAELNEIEAALSLATAPPSLQRHFVELFNLPLSRGERLPILPGQPIGPSWSLNFEPTGRAAIAVNPKPSHAMSPDACRNSVEIAFFGTSGWMSLGTAVAWPEIAGAERFQANVAAEPNRQMLIHVGLRLFARDGGFSDHFFVTLGFDPQTPLAVRDGELRLPDLAAVDTARPPLLMFFFADPKEGLTVRLDYINVYFA